MNMPVAIGMDIASVSADEAALRRWQSASANWLAALTGAAVTQLLCEAFVLYLDRCDGAARLIVLANGSPAQMDAFRAAVAAAGIAAHVELCVTPTPACVKAALLSADALLADDHGELTVAAMVVGTPIIALGADAAGGDAALYWDDADPALLAASVEHLRDNAALRVHLRARGFARSGAA